MPADDLTKIAQLMEHSSRLDFLYRAVEDTQNNIRFIDTKAAFCVTLISGMVAGALQPSHHPASTVHRVLFSAFMAGVALTLLGCLRVIFPVIKTPHAALAERPRPLPKFFVPHHPTHHWVRHALHSKVENVLCDDHGSYTGCFANATDEDLITTMCDTMLAVSLIRQIKSDRLHAAMYVLFVCVALFAGVMMV